MQYLYSPLLLTDEQDEAAHQAGEGHADVVGVPVRGAAHNHRVVAAVPPQREGHVARAQHLHARVTCHVWGRVSGGHSPG